MPGKEEVMTAKPKLRDPEGRMKETTKGFKAWFFGGFVGDTQIMWG